MNADEQKKQIRQMIKFIEQEAAEKAEEITTKASFELSAIKQTQLMKRSEEIKENFEKKREDIIIKKKIERSRKFGESKITTMQARDDKMVTVKAEVLKKLETACQSPQYEDLLTHLIVEGLLRVQEKKVLVQFREMDKKAAEAAIPKAKTMFEEIYLKEVGSPISITLTASPDYLPGPPEPRKPGCAGGVVLSARGRKIILRNTLDKRLDIAFYQLKPSLRALLFGERPAPEIEDLDEGGHH